MLLVARRDQAVHLRVSKRRSHMALEAVEAGGDARRHREEGAKYLALELYFLLILPLVSSHANLLVGRTYTVRRIPLRQSCLSPVDLGISFPAFPYKEQANVLTILYQNEREHHLASRIPPRRMGTSGTRRMAEVMRRRILATAQSLDPLLAGASDCSAGSRPTSLNILTIAYSLILAATLHLVGSGN